MRQVIVGLGLFLGLIAAQAMAQPLMFQEGKEYQRAPKDVVDNPTVQEFKKEANNKVQVLEFFSYGCNWCFKLDPYVDTWQKSLPDYVSFQRVPVEFQPSWHNLSKAYFTIMDLNAYDKIHPAIFSAIQNSQLTDASENALSQYFAQHGIKPEDFTKTFTSFNVDRRTKWASSASQAYRITAVPAIIVQGPTGTFISTVRMAGSEENLLKVVDFLIQQEHAAISQNKQ